MPLWQIYHPPGIFEDADTKAALAADITKLYTSIGLPAFYVVVHFNTISPADVYIGGACKDESSRPFIRIIIKHIAVRLDNDTETYRRTAGAIDNAIKPHIYDKDYDCEYHVEETERRLWKYNGLIPPEHKSEEHEVWVKENKSSPYDGAYWSAEKGRY